MKIGIVTVLYKSTDVIDGFVTSLNRQNFKNFHVFILENDTENHICEKKIREGADFDYHFERSSQNVGVAAGNNRGIDYYLLRDDISHVLFLNNDVEFDEDFLQKQCDCMLKHGIDCLAPKMYYFDPPEKIWYAGGEVNRLKNGPRHYGHNKPDKLKGKDIYPVTYAPTCSLLIKKDLFPKHGLRMWEQLFVYYDDYVFCLDLQRAGVRIFYAPDICLFHKISSSTGTNSEFSRYYSSRNWAYVARKTKNINCLFFPFFLVFNFLTKKNIENKGIMDSFSVP